MDFSYTITAFDLKLLLLFFPFQFIPRLTGYCAMYMCRPRLIDSGLKTVYLQVKNIWVIYMYMTLGGSRSLKVSKLSAETLKKKQAAGSINGWHSERKNGDVH